MEMTFYMMMMMMMRKNFSVGIVGKVVCTLGQGGVQVSKPIQYYDLKTVIFVSRSVFFFFLMFNRFRLTSCHTTIIRIK